MQRTASSSSPPSSVLFMGSIGAGCALEDFCRSSARPRFGRVWIVSSAAIASSRGSDDSEPDGVVFRGEPDLGFDLVARSARPEVLEEFEEWWEADCSGWLARAALEDRRDVSIVAMSDSPRGL